MRHPAIPVRPLIGSSSWAALPIVLMIGLSGCGGDQPTGPGGEPSFLVRPLAPSNASALAVAHDTIVVSWRDNAGNESGYQVHRSTTGATGTFSLRATRLANAMKFRDAGLAPLKSYCYKVRAFRTQDGTTSYSAFSNTACATTPAAPKPVAPSGNVARPVSSTAVRTTWTDKSSNEDGFRVQRSTDGGATWTTAGTVGPNITAFRDNGRSTERPVCYRVVSFNEHGSSAASNVDCTTPPAKPANLTASVTAQGSVTLAWAENSSVEDGYQVQRSTDGTTFSTIANLAANAKSYSDAGATSNTSYWYRVRAKKDGGFSDFSNVVSASNTGSVQVTVATTGVALDPNGYLVTVGVLTSTGLLPVTSNTVSTNGSVTFSGLPAGDSYRITLSDIATNCAATSPQTTSVRVGTTTEVRFDASCVEITIPAAPRLYDVAGFFLGITRLLWWDNSNNEDGFKIERCEGSCGEADFVLIAITGPNVTEYWDSGLREGVGYTYRLRATNRAGDSAPSFGAGRACSEELGDEMAPCY